MLQIPFYSIAFPLPQHGPKITPWGKGGDKGEKKKWALLTNRGLLCQSVGGILQAQSAAFGPNEWKQVRSILLSGWSHSPSQTGMRDLWGWPTWGTATQRPSKPELRALEVPSSKLFKKKKNCSNLKRLLAAPLFPFPGAEGQRWFKDSDIMPLTSPEEPKYMWRTHI